MVLNKKNSWWYTIILATLIIGFLLIFVWGILNLVIKELKDNRWETDYIKAYAAAEWAQELALLKIKEKWYWYYEKVEAKKSDSNAVILASDINNFNKAKDVLISYDLWSKTKTFSWTLKTAWDELFPLFVIKADWTLDEIDKLNLKIIFWTSSNLWWTITSSDWNWIWWRWEFDFNTIWKWRDKNANFVNESIWDFLTDNSWSYLMLFSIDPNNEIKYELTSNKYFTKPRIDIISSAEIWGYKQNLKTTLDNTKFLNILKYSIFSK